MSYDVWLTIDTGGEEPATVHDCGNMTSNVSPMWKHALESIGFRGQETNDRGTLLSGLEGMKGYEALVYLQPALAHMQDPANLEIYTSMNPSNGWGSVESAIRFLKAIIEGCRKHPRAQLRFST